MKRNVFWCKITRFVKGHFFLSITWLDKVDNILLFRIQNLNVFITSDSLNLDLQKNQHEIFLYVIK